MHQHRHSPNMSQSEMHLDVIPLMRTALNVAFINTSRNFKVYASHYPLINVCS